MGKIVAIGGGYIGSVQEGKKQAVETLSIDKEIICLSGKPQPKLLFIPTASSDAESYVTAVQNHFGKRLGCTVDMLYLMKNPSSVEQISQKILSADIIYVGGGNTLKMMNRWKRLGVDKALKKAYLKGVVLSGLSAGCICWFKCGNSDSRKYYNKKDKLIKVSGLGFIGALGCPHYDVELERAPSLKEMMKTTKDVAIALENCVALEVVDKSYRIISSQKGKHAYKIYYKKGKYHKEEIPQIKEFLPLRALLSIT